MLENSLKAERLEQSRRFLVRPHYFQPYPYGIKFIDILREDTR
uniref:Uncharacterized protein n=1 Tax=uncultured Sphingobacteriales bacterium HF0010_19H17 TaxID=710990 RepID=E0XRD8_9SPHI|nr:hypothetical protein [uncultured Sphingobacteriales bacterium HF0010_19H17]